MGIVTQIMYRLFFEMVLTIEIKEILEKTFYMRKFVKANKLLSIKILIVLLYVLLNIVFYYVSSIATTNSYEVMLEQSMSHQLKVVEDFFRYPENIINILSQNKDLPRYKGDNRFLKNDILSLFESIIISDSRISNIYFIPSKGSFISYKYTRDTDVDLTRKIWYENAIEGKKQFTWISHKSIFLNDDVISCVRRIVDKDNKLIGVVGLDIELFKLSELIQNVKIGNYGYFMILDENNKIIADPYYNRLGQNILDDNLMKSTNNKSFILEINNEKFKCKISKIKTLPWKIISAVPVSEITYSIIVYVILFIILSMVSFIISFMMYSKNKITQQSNQKLKIANEKLKEYASTIEELAISQERNRLARDVHDTLGQTLSIIVTLLQVSILSCKKDGKETEKHLSKAIKITRDGLNEVRRSILGLVPEKLEKSMLFDALERLVNDFECVGMNIELSVNKLDHIIDTEYEEVIYRICQEALTNSLKHGKATEVNIIIKFSDSYIKLFIFDNGFGCIDKSMGKGCGLQGMKERIEKLNGNINFGSSGEKGFNIHVELPLNKTGEG